LARSTLVGGIDLLWHAEDAATAIPDGAVDEIAEAMLALG
jgi:hypothetical protein